jgi:hypothetical protein
MKKIRLNENDIEDLVKKIIKEEGDWDFMDDVDEWYGIKEETLRKLIKRFTRTYYVERKGDTIFIHRTDLEEGGGGYVVEVDEHNTKNIDDIKYSLGNFIEYEDYPEPWIDWEEDDLSYGEIIEFLSF